MVARYSHFTSLSFEEKLELYELLDLDAVSDSEDDPDINFNATTEDILRS